MSAPRLELEILGRSGRTPLPERDTLVVGASEARAGLVVAGAGVQDAHCVIGRAKGGGWAIKDLGSRSGTRVNGASVQSARLAHGDVIELGGAKLRVVDPERSAQVVAAAGATSVPERIGGFKIERRLGRGGMGEVYLAIQESLHRPVALKVLSAKLDADEPFVERFLAEARAAAALNHPNVVTVYDVGEVDGHHYLAMEYMDEGSLEDRVARQNRLEPREALASLRDAAAGLVFAEERGIVHRDIKPANLMCNAAGTTKIADLGLAVRADDDSFASGDKRIFGTPHFISPEQARGETVDHRSDLYSLGATFYRLLTGRTPFRGETTRDILRGHFQEAPTPVRELAPGVDEGLASLVERLLAKAPADRPQSARAVLADAERWLAGGVSAPADAGSGGSKSWVLIAGALAVAGGIAVVASGMLGGEDPAPAPAGPDPVVQGGDEPDGPRTPDLVDAGGGDEPVGVDDPEAGDPEADRVRELEARLAYAELGAELAPRERRDALLALAERFDGTPTAELARGEADEIDRTLEAEQAAAARLATRRDELREELRATLDPWLSPPLPGPALAALGALDAPEDPAEAPLRAALVGELFDGLLRSAELELTGGLESAEAAAEVGDFETVENELRALLPLFQGWPEVPREQLPERARTLLATGDEVQARIAELGAEQAAWRAARASGDAERLGAAIGSGSGFAAELSRLELEAALDRLDRTSRTLVTEDSGALVDRLSLELQDALRAFDVLRTSYRDGRWRRTSILVPSERDHATANVLDVIESGLRVETEAGEEFLPWERFASDSESVHQFFHLRLEDEYDESELLAIAALLRVTAACETIAESTDVLEEGSRARVSDREAELIEEAWERASEWTELAGDPARAARERRAAELLVEALVAASDGAWALSVSRLEHLLADFGDTWIVVLLSEGPAATREALAPPATGESSSSADAPTDDAETPTAAPEDNGES